MFCELSEVSRMESRVAMRCTALFVRAESVQFCPLGRLGNLLSPWVLFLVAVKQNGRVKRLSY